MPTPIAPSADTREQRSPLRELADGVPAGVAQDDPGVGAQVLRA